MSFYKFDKDDILNTSIVTSPAHTVEMNGDQVTGSIHLEKEFLDSSLKNRLFYWINHRGKLASETGPFVTFAEMTNTESGETLYGAIQNLYSYYSFFNPVTYTSYFTGSESTSFRIITIPQLYYDKEIATGSFSASDIDSAGDTREIFDDGRGGIYSGSLTGTLVGNIFYSEGIVVLKGGGLNDYDNLNEFGDASLSNFKWRVRFKGTHKIPVKIFKCRAPAGELNASTNETFYTVPTGSDDEYRNERKIVLDEPHTYITTIGLYNDDYELVALAKLAQPIKKDEENDILFRLRLDF